MQRRGRGVPGGSTWRRRLLAATSAAAGGRILAGGPSRVHGLPGAARRCRGRGRVARLAGCLAFPIGRRPRYEHTTSSSRGPDGRRSTSTTINKVPILEPAQLRTLPFGTGILLMKSAPPIALTLPRWTERKDASSLSADRDTLEAHLRAAASRNERPPRTSAVTEAL